MPSRQNTRISERPGRPVANPDRDTRTQLIDAATEAFAQQGVAATTLRTIADRAGLTPAMVHYHFKDRDQLIDAVVSERLAPLISHVWEPVRAGDDPAEMLAGIVERLLQQIERAPWIPSTWMREILTEEGLLRSRIVRRLPFDKVKIVAQAVAAAQARGDLNADLDPFLLVFSTLGMVMVHMATMKVWAQVLQRPLLDREALQRHIVGLLRYGVSSPGKPAGKMRSRSFARSRL
jgi:AcrR family transcriptional regulator